METNEAKVIPISKRTLAMKLVEVMACIDRVAKNGVNSAQNYKYAMAADVYNAVRDELAKRFVLMTPTVVKSDFFDAPTKAGGVMRYCTLHVRYDFVDGESGEVHTTEVVGQGSDSGDKAVYKAMTGATKTCLVNQFLIPTGDDPENEAKAATSSPPSGTEGLRTKVLKRPTPPSAPNIATAAQRAANGTGAVFPNYGNAKGMPIHGAQRKDLDFYASGARRSIADPAKARFHDSERALLAAIEAEIHRQANGSQADNEPPMPTDDDRPF